MKKFLTFLAAALTIAACAPKDENEAKAEKLMRQMTLQEKIGQLAQFVSKNGTVTGPKVTKR